MKLHAIIRLLMSDVEGPQTWICALDWAGPRILPPSTLRKDRPRLALTLPILSRRDLEAA